MRDDQGEESDIAFLVGNALLCIALGLRRLISRDVWIWIFNSPLFSLHNWRYILDKFYRTGEFTCGEVRGRKEG